MNLVHDHDVVAIDSSVFRVVIKNRPQYQGLPVPVYRYCKHWWDIGRTSSTKYPAIVQVMAHYYDIRNFYGFLPFNFVLRTEIDDVAHLDDGAAVVAPQDFSRAATMLK